MSESGVVQWVNSLSGSNISGLEEGLKSGEVLCALVNKIKPNTITGISKYNAAHAQMQNIDKFLTVAGKLGVSDEDKFKAEDLYYGNNIPKVILTLVSFQQLAASKYGAGAGSLSGYDLNSLRSTARSSQKEGGKQRQAAAQPGAFFAADQKAAQNQASSAARGHDKIVKEGMQEMEATSELGFIDKDKKKHQELASASGAHGRGQDSIVRSEEKAVASSELGFIDRDKGAHQKLASASGAHGRGQDSIVRSEEKSVSSGELGFIDRDKAAHQKLASASGAHGRGQDSIVRSEEKATVTADLGFIDSDKRRQQELASSSGAHGKGMDQIVRGKGQGDVADF